MEASQPLTCPRLRSLPGDPNSLVRFVVGSGDEPVPLDPSEIARLGDPLARHLFSNSVFPTTAEGVLDALGNGDPLSSQSSFVVGEGSQLPPGVDGAGIRAFLVTRGEGEDGPDIILSALGRPDNEFVEVLAWDTTAGGFNYYTTDRGAPWVLAGNSADAFREGSAGFGPFESHPSGNVIMKELRRPWVHWQSRDASVRVAALPPKIASHRWFTQKKGAETFETQAVMPAIKRWNRVRLNEMSASGSVASVPLLLRSFLGTPTVNLVSSLTDAESVLDEAAPRDFTFPGAFLADTECLSGVLGLAAPTNEQRTVSGAAYREVLVSHSVTLRLDDGTPILDPPSDTHFVFVVPERAFEDIDIVRGAVERGLVSKRLAACLLMVDFPNPVFSPRRESLLAHLPETAPTSDLSGTIANAILDSDKSAEEGTPEREFKDFFEVGDEWPTRFDEILREYYAAATAALETPDRLDALFRLAESRRAAARALPIMESPLLFARPETPISPGLRMERNGSIA